MGDTLLSLYPYADGDLLSSPQAYTYSPFHGSAFFEAWRVSRYNVVSGLTPQAPQLARSQSRSPYGIDGQVDTAVLLETLLADFQLGYQVDDINLNSLLSLLKTFEVTKRIQSVYSKKFYALPESQFYNLSNYLRTGVLFDAAYAMTEKLYFLNGFIKILDILWDKNSLVPS